ncbi:MFS transporter [Herbiconiux sp. L3-i23]|uniref:MFS transporter n=1 Tax=Herbiconiux sp. L3-i23 TaxID=2905871 RepID=UPI002073B9A4|nr:MFS transporter [Herbiconiux sp. L3-i23]
MSTPLLRSHASTASRPRARFGFWIVAVTFTTIMAFSTVPTPLYALYQERDGFPTAVVTVIFAAYAVGVILSLYFAGHISDWLGRRPIILAAVLVQLLSATMFLFWSDVPGLLVARFVNGVGVGMLTATATAHLSELGAALRGPTDRRASVIAGFANLGGLGLGSLISALIAVNVAAPLEAPYEFFLVLLVVEAIALLFVPETVVKREEHVAYRPQRVAVPSDSRGVFWASAIASLGAFAVFGMFSAVAPAVLRGVMGETSLVVAGAVAFAAFASASIAQAVFVGAPLRRQLQLAIVSAVVGLVVLIVGTLLASLAAFVLGAVLTGAGVGLLFRVALGVAGGLTTPERRGEVLAAVFLAAYVGISVPVLLIGAAFLVASQPVVVAGFGAVAVVVIVLTGVRMLRRLP